MRATVPLFVIVGACACGEIPPPTAPTTTTPSTTPTTSALPTPTTHAPNASDPPAILSFSMTGQLVQGVYHDWPDMTIGAGGAFYLSSEDLTGRVMVTLSYVDASGRSATSRQRHR